VLSIPFLQYGSREFAAKFTGMADSDPLPFSILASPGLSR
jgi:hypothetical protein